MENKLLGAALNYAALGVYIFPLRPGAKAPAVRGWQKHSTTNPEKIKKWWTENPAYNIGIDCGKSGIFVVDFDAANGKPGLSARDKWHAEHDVPQTWTALTPRGGVHEYFQGDAQTKTGLYPGVDVRAAGGLVAAPPSVFNGVEYRWEKPPILFPLSPADSSVYTFLSPVPDDFDRQRTPYRVPDAIAEGGRTSALVALAGSLMGKGLTPEAAEAAIREENEQRCFPPLTDAELEREVFPALRRDKWQQTTAPYTHDLPVMPGLLDKLRALDPANSKVYGMNDAGSARLFMDTCGGVVQYASDRRKWLFFDGTRWDADGENAVKEMLKQLADALTVYALRDIKDESKRSEYLKFSAKWQQLRQRETILKDAASVRPVKMDIFDRDPYLLNCQNGTLNLRTGEFREHRAADMLSRIASVSYDPAATAPRWLRFMDEVTAGDAELSRYLQKAAGYALTGDTRHECLFLLHGATSRNGKSTFLETLAACMGDYAASANPETFTKHSRANDNSPSEDIARLAGVRFVTVSEPPRGMELNAALVKSLTGRDSIKARRLYEASFEFVPQFKLFFNTNHRPRVDDMTVFESERIKLIPFSVHFTQSQRDPYLKDTLQAPASLSGVLNWAIDGLKMLQTEGFTMPQVVTQATEEYRRKQDKMLQFLEEKTESGDGFEVPLMELHTAFGNWCCSSGLVSVSIPRFKELLEERQIITKKKRPAGTGRAGKTAVFALGLRLIEEK